jgi:MFS family permease
VDETTARPAASGLTRQVVTGERTSTFALMVALLAACFAFQLNASMLSPALKGMEAELDATTAQIGLTQTAFFTSAAALSLFLPRLADLFGRRRVLSTMMLLTAVGCVISALAPGVGWLFVGRVIQGVAGPTVVMCLIVLRVHVRDPRTYATLMGVITAINGGIAGVDAIGGGYLSEHHGYASIFWVMAVVAVLAAVALRTLSNESTVVDPPRMDWIGSALLVVSVGALYLALNELGSLTSASWSLIGILMLVSLSGFVAFAKYETRTDDPLVAVEHLRSRASWALLLTTLLTMTGVFAVMNQIVPALAQDAEVGVGLSASAAPFVSLTPYALAGLAMGPLSGYLAGRFGYKRVLQVGLAGAAVGTAFTLLLVGSTSTWLVAAVSIVVGITYAGMANIMLNGLCVILSPDSNPGYLPGLNAGAFNLGAGLSFVVLPLVQTLRSEAVGPAAGYTGGIVAGVIILILAFGVSFLVPDPRLEDSARS